MSLIEEARSQLEVELTSYIRNAQKPYSPILPPIDDGLPSFHATLAKKPAAGLAATTAVVAAPADTGKAVKGSSKGGGATTAVAATSTSPSPSRAGSQKQARAKLLELVRKLQRAALVSAQVSKDEAGAADGSGGESSLLTRRGSRKEGGGLSREPSLFSAPLTTKSAVTNLPALPAAATRNVRTTSAEKIRKGAPGTSAAAAAAGGTTSASNTDVAAAPAKRADGRGASPHPPAQSFISLSLANTQTSQSFHRRLGDIERSHSTATSFSGRERSSSPHSSMRTNNNNSSAANSANALRRLEASLTFTKDCLHYAAMFAEAGLTQEAQSCFLQLIAQDITSHYEPIVTRCIERHPRTVARQTPQQSSQQQQQRNEAGAGTPGHPLRRHRVSKGKSFKDGQKQNLFSPNGAELASPSLTAPTTPTANEAQRTGNAAEDGVGGVRVTDNLDTFASDVPLPLALQVYKCVLHYRALLTYIRFHDLLQADVYGDAAGMASSTAACACIEEMVAQQQRVLYTAPFSAASVIHQEEARMREDMERTAAVMKPVSAIIVTGGYKLLDLLAEPESAKPSVTSLSVTSLLDDAPALVYAVDEVAAPVLFTTRLYVAKMAEQLLAYLRSTASGEMAQPGCGELRPAVTQRCLEALQASVSMSELHLNKATPQLQQQPQQSTQPRQPCTKTCLPLASVDYLPWRLQEYTLLQRGYLQLEDDTAAAVTAAEHALQQVLQLVELEYLDPVPPPPSTTLALDAAVQQCAGWLLVATWRAAVAQGGSGISSSSNTSNAYLAFASASPEASAVQPPGEAAVTGTQTPLAAATTTTTASAGGSFADSGAGGDSPASTALHMATTARTAMAAIAAAVQQAVAFLVTASWAPASTGGAASNPMHDMSPRRASRRGGGGAGNMIPSITTAVAITAAAAAGGGDTGGATPSMNGTRLLVVLWACMALVQQQCALLAGRSAVAAALAAAAKETDYTDATADDGAEVVVVGGGDEAEGGNAPGSTTTTPPPQQQQQQGAGTAKRPSPSRSPPPRKSNAKGKTTVASSSINTAPGEGAGLAGGVAPASPVPAELRHDHPAVVHLAGQFPRLSLDLILHLVGVVEAAGAVPQAPPYKGSSSSRRDGKRRSAKGGDGAAGHDRESARKRNESAERRSARGGRQRASIVALGCDSSTSSLNPFSGASAGYAATASLRRRALQSVYRGCVEALEVLLHAAAVKATSAADPPTTQNATAAAPLRGLTGRIALPLSGASTSTSPASATATAGWRHAFGPLSTLTLAAVWNDTVDVLGYCDEIETEGDVVASGGGGGGALHDGKATLPLRHARYYSPSAGASLGASVCFLYNPADTRCVLRWISWDALFSVADGAAANRGNGAGLLFTSRSLVEAGVVRAVTALRTLVFASPRLVVAVRVGLAMESWWRAQLTPPAKKSAPMKSTGNSTAAAAATFRAASSTTTTTSVECAMRCAQLLRALLLAVMLHQNHPRRLLQQQQQEEEPPQHSTSQKKSPLTSVLGLFEDAAYALDVLAPLAAPSAPSLVSSPAGEICQPGERLASPPPSSSCVEAHSAVDDYTRLAAQAQASLHLSRYQRRILRDGDGHEAVALREYFEEDDMNEALSYTDEVWSPLPSSMSLFKVAAVLVEKVAAALCPAVDESPSSNHTVSNNNSFAPPSPSCAALLLQPIATDAGSFFLRCGEALRAQWQQQRSRRLLQQVGHNEVAATGAEDTSAETAAAAVVASRDPFRAQEELEAREESHYATIVWCVLSFLWHSSSSGAPQLDERGVAAVTRRASNGFLQLLPSATAERGGTMATTMTGGPRMAPVQLSRLLAHGATVRRLLELTRSHLQAHVESLLRHASALVTVASPYGSSSYLRGYHGHTYPSKNPSSSTAAAAQQRQATTASTCRALVAARDGLTELTHVWVTVRWHLSRLHAHHADYTARHVDLETLQQRHDQQQIYGRPTAKELRILRTLEQDAPLLPTTAKDEEVRLKRWVKDQQHTAAGTALATSAQLLEALVCAALVPLNTADPSAQQKLVDEAVRALTDVEMITGTEATHRPGSGGGSSSTGRNTTAQQQQQQQAPRCTQEAFVIYTPILLWCYLAEACSRCGTAEQTALVRGVLDRYLLTESPEVSNADTADAVLTTAPFVQKLLLRPQWAVLEDCSLTTRMAFCRALSALASRSTPASSSAAAASSSSTSALGSLQSAYRLLLALQIQQLPEPSAAAATALRAAHHAANKTKKNDTAGVGLGNTDSVQRHGPSSKLTLSSAQQLLSAITEYLTRSADTAASRDGSPAAALLLPLLVELCNVLLHLPASSPQWADGDVQLFALRVVVLFKQQQMALLTASPSPLTVGTANATATASASASAAAVAAAAAAAVMMDAFLQLLWTTFAHVWNGVFRNPNSRQRRFLHTSAAVTLWAQRVFDHHRRHTLLCAAAVQDDDSGERGNGGNSPASSRPGRSPRRKRDNSNHTTGTDGALLSDTVSPLTPATVDPNANPLYFAGVAYLPGEDDGSYPHHDEERPGVGGGTPVPVAGGVSEGESVERHRASPQRPRTGGPGSPNNTNARGGAAFFSTVFLHAHMPCEFMELLEDILFHLPSLWTYILAPPGTVAVPAVSAALNRSASPTAASEHDGVSRMQTQYDFVCHAALQAAQALRELQHFANSGNEPAAGERRGSATGTPTTGGQLCGLRPIYIEIVAALQQYGVAMRNSNSAASGGGAQQQGGHNTSSAAAAAAAATASGARGGGNARSRNSSVNTPAVSSACHGLMETLNKYNEDPNYAKLAVHVVREMLALCNDDTQSISMGGAALSNAAAAGGGGGGGGGSSASGSSGSNSRKKNPSAGGGAAAGGAEGSNSISGGVGGAVSGKMSACVSAAAVTMDVRHVIRSVRAQVHEHHCAIRAFLASVDAETEAWLTRGGFNLAGQVQQQQQQQHEQKGPQQGTQGSGPSPPASPSAATAASPTAADAGSAKAAAASTSRKKTNRKGNKKRAGGRSKKADVRGNDDDDTDDDEANRTGEAAPSTGLPYTEVTRDFSFVEEQKLKQLTCGVARWRRSRAGRTLRQRYVQFNTPYVAQLHLIEAALLHMGATAQHDAAKQKRILQELLARTDGAGGDAPTAHAAAAAAGGAGTSPSSLRLSPRDTKKSSVAPPPTSSCDDADTESPTQVTEDLLRHCVCASNLFQHLWLPARASAAVQLAVSHLQEAPLPLAPSSPALAALVSQLLVTPLFAIAAVQQGYCDARRDVHNCVLQPPVIKVGAAVSWSRRNDLLCTAPSLFTLTSVAGKRGEQKMARRAGVQARQQRRFHLLQLCWCVEAEAETRAEATRDELQERVRILQVAQQLLLPLPEQSTSLKALLASAAELLARVSEKGKRTGRLVNSARQTWAGKNPVSTAAHPTREAAHTGAVDTLPYSPFEGMGGGSTGAHGGSNASTRPPAIEADTTTRKGKGSEGTSSSSSLTSVDAAAYGRDMTEADLVHQLIALAHALEQASPATSAAAYRTAQQLTNGRYATELLPRLMQLEENDEGCEPEVRGATVLAYEKGLRSVSDGVWLLRSARSVRRQWSTSPVLPNAAVNRAGPSTQSSTSTSGAVSWKAAMEAYQRAAQALRAAGRLHLLGECLYEQGCLYCAAGRLKEAERNWMDALDCLLSTPHVFDDWHTQRIVPPPLIASSSSSSSSASTSHRGVEELVWMVAALTSLAEHAYATDASRAMAAQLLCALLVHQYWRLPAVMEGSAGGSSSDVKDASRLPRWHDAGLPYSEYNQLDVAALSATSPMYREGKAIRSSQSQRDATQMPDTLAHIVHALTNAAQLLVQSHCSSEAAVLGAFSDFMATVHLQQVELTVAARLVRATAAADLGSFSVAMRHIHSVCVGAGLPQPVRGVLGMDSLPGYYSIAAAVAAAATSRAAGAPAPSISPTPAKKPAAGTGALTGGSGSVSGGSFAGSAAAALASGSKDGGGGALSLSAAATVLPASVASLFFFYRDDDSPSSPHNIAAVRAFVLACLPGLAVDSVLSLSSPTSRTMAAAATTSFALPLVGGLLASPALESRYGVCLLRRLCLTVAEVLVRLGTGDLTYLFRSPPSLSSLSRTATGSEGGVAGGGGGRSACAEFVAAAPISTTAAAPGTASGGHRRGSSPAPPSSAGSGSSLASLAFSSAAFPLLATGERPTSACSEACRFALVLLNSLRSVDVRYALVGQPSAAVGSAALGAGEETDNTTSSRATRVSAETNARTRAANVSGGDAGYTGSDPARAAAAASAVMQSFAGEAERGSAAPSAQSVAWLDTLAAISQWAVLLTGEVLAAQGQYNACLQLLTSAIADYNDEQAAVAPSVAGEARQRSISPSPQPTPTAMIQSLRGYGLQGSRGGGGGGSKSGTSLPFNCTYVHWMRVWQLMCRCYCLLRRYAQLENAAGAQGLRLCDAFGETGAQRRAFQLYRLYALTQMGQLKEAAVVAADLQRAAAPFLTLTPEKETDGTLDDGSAAVALLWWQTEQANAGTSPRSSAVSARRLVTQLFKVAVAERGVLPWHPLSPSRPVVVLESPNAHTVVPLCPLSGCAKTRDVWQLHHAMNHYASELQWQMPPSSPSPQPPGGKVSMSAGGSVRNRALLSAPPSTDAPSATVVASTPSAIVLLREALEAVGAQYTTQAHPGQWLESQLLLTRLRARAVCDALNARQRRSNDDDDNTNNSATVEFALDDGAPSITTAGVAAEPSRAVPVLSSRDAALNALPAPVHDVCEELLRTLQLLLQFPVQRHTMLRVVLLDLAAVLSAHIRDVRTRRRRDTKRTAPAAATAAATEEALLPQFEAVVAACTILAGLVTDMERRVRTGADSFRGYLTDPRLASSEAGDTIALLLQAQWPESLCAAVQQTHDNVGQLQSASARMNAHGGGGGGTSPSPSLAAEVISHPFYALPEVQQQFFGASATAAAGASGSVTATGAAANAGNSSSGRSGSGGNRDQGAANVGSGVKRGGGGAAASLQSSSSAAGVATAAAAAASPLASLLSVPALALTFTTLSDEAAAVLALTPVATALEHDTAVQLLTSHLQSLSPPINCTYLCYRDDTRQQLLEAVGAVLIHQQQLQQPHPKGTGSAQRKSSSTVLRRLGGAGGSAQGGASNAGGITALNFTEADVWKALVPPVLLSALPVDLFSAVGPDTLGAPLYNSVAAAAVEVPGHSPPSFVYGKKSGQTFSTAAAAGGDAAGGRAGESTTATWQLFLSVSPLHDAGITEAPVLTSTSSSSAQAALSTDAVLLLPPAHLVAAANFTASGGGVGGSAGSDGGAGVASAQGASMASTGGAAAALGASAGGGGGSSVAFSRGRNTTRLFGAVNSTVAAASTTVAPAHRSSDQDTVMSHAGVSGTVWPPAQTSTSPRAACLVPSTNWAFLDQIQREGLSGAQTRVEENAATTTTTAPVKPTSPAPGIRTHAAGKTTRGGNAATGGASSPSHAATHHTTHESTKTCSPGLVEAAAQVPVTFRWRSVSLEMSDSTVQTLRRHLRAVLRCLHRAGEEDATAETADQADAVLEAAKAEADGGRGENATRSALAAAVSKAQQTLRTHLATAGGAMSSNSNAASGGGVGLGSSGGGGSSAFFASTLPATAGSGGSLAMSVSNASAGAISASTSNNSSSIMRKSAQRVGAANANSSGNNTTDSSLLALAGGAVNENTATHDDLAAAVRARQMAERERQRQQHAEELEEAKASLLRELLEAVVSAAVGFGTAVAVVDEARVELDVRRLMPRCPLTPTMVDFLCDWLGGVSAETVDGDEGGDDADAGYNGSSSGHTSLCFYNAGLHEWMQRVAQYVAEQQQQQQRSSPNSVLM